MRSAPFDLAVIGGGINGCGIARDAAGRGLSVFLCEKSDLAAATSSASTKLIHGGLRYLEHYEFRLVRESLIEREVLLRAAPHIIRPLRFVLPHHKGLRPAWLIRLGLFLYDHLGGRDLLPPARRIDLRRHEAGEPLKGEFSHGFEYSDCSVEDSRLVLLNAMDAAARGARIEPRTELLRGVRKNGAWLLILRDHVNESTYEVASRGLVNAAGPWVAQLAADKLGLPPDEPVRLVKGSHIIVRQLFRHEWAYVFQNADSRIVFAIPYERDFTLIGTTDIDYYGDPGEPRATEAEIAYLCSAASEYFAQRIAPEDVVRTYAGVRPLYDDGASSAQAATRDYVLKVEAADGSAPLLNIFGGKITTYRKLAEAALEKLVPFFRKMGPAWTEAAALPGGDFPAGQVEAEAASLRALCPSCTPSHAMRLVRAYGTRARILAGGVRSAADWGERFGADLTQREVRYLMDHEWARTAEDVLWRRSKLGLGLAVHEVSRLDEWMRGADIPKPRPALALGAAS